MKKFTLLLLLVLLPLQMWGQKKISILGDSYSTYEGYMTPSTNLSWYAGEDGGPNKENDVISVEQTWWKQMIDKAGLKLEINNSYSGSTVCYTGYDKKDYSDRAFITRMNNLGNPDIIVILGGTNDSWANSPIGKVKYKKWKKADLYSFCPAFCYMLNYITKHYPNATIINVCNSELKEEITQAQAKICKKYGVKHILLKDVEKQWGHPSIAGMTSICNQILPLIQ